MIRLGATMGHTNTHTRRQKIQTYKIPLCVTSRASCERAATQRAYVLENLNGDHNLERSLRL